MMSFFRLTVKFLLKLGVPVVLGAMASAQYNAQIVDEGNGALAASPQEDLFRIAGMLYDQAKSPAVASQNEKVRLFRLSAQRYREYAQKFPQSTYAEQAMYREALCYLELGQLQDAQRVLANLVRRYQKGDFVASSAYRLATMDYKAGNYRSALDYFSVASKESTRQEMRQDALYRSARCYLMLNLKNEAVKVFTQLANNDSVASAFRSASMMALAGIEIEANRIPVALQWYSRVCQMPDVDTDNLGRALLQAASLALKADNFDQAELFYKKILATSKLSEFSGEAQVGLMTVYYREKKYNEVLSARRRNVLSDNPELEAQRELLAGQSAMALNKLSVAIECFGRVEQLVPGTDMAFESAYRRLLCAQNMNWDGLDAIAESFIRKYGEKYADKPYIHMARILLADRMVKTNPEAAIELFNAVNVDLLPTEMRADVLYKKAWVLSKSKEQSGKALKALEDFISQYPNDARMPEALVLRGEIYTKSNDEVAALADFNRIIKEYPTKDVAAMAWQRAAQLYLNKQDIPNMIKYYSGLIKNFPNTKPAAMAEAHYMMGKGYFDTKQFPLAIPHLDEAAKIYPDKYSMPATLLLVTSFYHMQDFDKLKAAYDKFDSENRSVARGLPESIPAWLGSQCFVKKNYADADKYLTISVNATDPHNIQKVIWSTLAKARMRSYRFERALKAVDSYLSVEDNPARKAQALLDKAVILSNLGNQDQARTAAESALKIGVEGPIKASLNIVLGDIAYAQGKFDEAGRLYGMTASLFTEDRELKPQAMYKASVCLAKAGKTAESAQFADDLKKEFPGWKPEEKIFLPMN